jgi:putative two-component system response regulator
MMPDSSPAAPTLAPVLNGLSPPLPTAAPRPHAADAAVACFDPVAFAQMQRMVADLGRMYRERNEALEEVTRAHHEALFRLALAAEYRDDDTGAHIVRMGFVAERLGLLAGLPTDQAEMLRRAAPMHDVGKIGIPDRVLKKPGPFDASERLEMNKHPEMGANIMGSSRIPLFRLAAEVALSHHERWDGKGYPARLAGEAIPISGRIAAIADFFDALTMDRCYRMAFSDERALQMLQAERGHAFDPRLVDLFIEHAAGFIALRDHINHLQPSFADLVAGVRLP